MACKEVTVEVGDGDSRIQESQSMDLNPEAIERIQFTVEGTERGPPPTYEEAMNPASAPPPTYESVIGRVREASKQSSGTVDFIKKVIVVLAGTIGFTIALAVTVVIPAVMVIIGSNYFFECPVNAHIPLYLLVGGVVGVTKQLLQVSQRIRRGHENRLDEEAEERSSSTQSMLNCFMMVWFLLGTYWVYREYQPSFDPRSGALYCNKILYLFAFWQITFVYILLGLMTFCLCSVSLCFIGLTRRQLQNLERETEHIQDE